METRKMKLALSAGALALSLALAGCGGGGSSGTPSGPTQAELDAATQQAAEEKAAKEKAEMEKAAEEAARKEAEEKLAEKEAAERKAAAAASLKDAKALFTAAEEGTTRWDHIYPTDWMMPKAKYGGTTTISGASADGTTFFDRKTKVDGKDTPLGRQGESLGMVGKWSGTMLSASENANAALPSDTVVIYTNIGKDTPMSFDDVYGADDILAATNAKKVAGSDFGTGNAQKTHLPNTKVTGTFDGASGTYTCEGNENCTSQAGDGGGIELSDGWTFKANPGATVMEADATYAYFGWWLDKTDANTFSVHAFHDGMGTGAAPIENVTALSGMAKYMGPAVGKYAMVHDDGDGPSHTGGHFTAMADLMADFGDSESTGAKVTGSIKDFVGGSDTMDTWEVKLSGTGASGTAVWHIGDNKGQSGNTSFVSVFREVSKGEPTTLTGTWRTRFDPQENTVTGHMIGAFGATKQ